MTRFGDSAGGASVLDISRLSAVSTEIAALGPQVTAISDLGPVSAEIGALGTSSSISILNALTTTDSNGDTVALPGLATLSGVATEIADLGTPTRIGFIDAIGNSVVSGTTQLTLDTVGQDIQSVQLVATSIGNVNAVATSSGAVLFHALSEAPTAPSPANAYDGKGLKYDSSGNLVTADIITSDPTNSDRVTVPAALTVTTNADVTSNATIGGTLGVTGSTTLGSTLGVTGDTTLGGTLGVTGNTSLSSASLSGTLGVTGASTFAGVSAAAITSSAVVSTSINTNPTVTSGSIAWDIDAKQMLKASLTTASQTIDITYSASTPVGSGYTAIIDGGGASPSTSLAAAPLTGSDGSNTATFVYISATPPEHTDVSAGSYLIVSLIYLGSNEFAVSYVTVE